VSRYSDSLDQIADPVVADAIRTKLEELDVQIVHFKKENAKVAAMRQQRIDEADAFEAEAKKSALDLEQRENEFHEYKREQSAKLRRERKVWETHRSEARTGPSKGEREQIESLQKEVDDLQQQLADQKRRSSLAAGRYKDTIDTVTRRNAELEEEVRLLEEMRLNAWSNKPPYSRGGGGGAAGSIVGAVSAAGGGKQRDPRPLPNRESQATNYHDADDDDDGIPTVYTGGRGRESSSRTGDSAMRTATSNSRPPRDGGVSSSSGGRDHASINSGDGGSGSTNAPPATVGAAASVDPARGNVWVEEWEEQRQEPEQAPIPHSANGYPGPPQKQPMGGQRLPGVASGSVSGSPRRPHAVHGGSDNDSASMSADAAAARNAATTNRDNGMEGVPVTSRFPDGKVEKVFPNGAKLVTFPNGTNKEFFSDGHAVVRFFNGDLKQTYANGQVVYFYAESKTTHTTYPDGLELLEFANGQTEKNYPDGTQEIGFPDKTSKFIYANGEEETVFPDGTVQRLTANGERAIDYPNGQQEVHTANYKKRRYPDGTVKIVYPDGRQETKYANGRVRVKDKDGYVIVDTTLSQSQQQQQQQQQQQNIPAGTQPHQHAQLPSHLQQNPASLQQPMSQASSFVV